MTLVPRPCCLGPHTCVQLWTRTFSVAGLVDSVPRDFHAQAVARWQRELEHAAATVARASGAPLAAAQRRAAVTRALALHAEEIRSALARAEVAPVAPGDGPVDADPSSAVTRLAVHTLFPMLSVLRTLPVRSPSDCLCYVFMFLQGVTVAQLSDAVIGACVRVLEAL